MLNEKKKVSLKNLVWRGEGYKKIFAEIFHKKMGGLTRKGWGKNRGGLWPSKKLYLTYCFQKTSVTIKQTVNNSDITELTIWDMLSKLSFYIPRMTSPNIDLYTKNDFTSHRWLKQLTSFVRPFPLYYILEHTAVWCTENLI